MHYRMEWLRTTVVCFISLLMGTALPASAQQCHWSALGSGIDNIDGDSVGALAIFNDDAGPALYAAGGFTTAGDAAANNIAKWDGTRWSPLGSGTDGRLFALAVFNDGTGPALYAGGNFTTAGGVTVNGVAKWDGKQWSMLGSGISGSYFNAVLTLAPFNDGKGWALYAGGQFATAGGVPANNIAKWDGKQWSALRGGTDDSVYRLTVFNDGSGPALYAGGRFQTADGMTVHRVAKWDGQQWSALGGGFPPTGADFTLVSELNVVNDGTGPALYAGSSDYPCCGTVAKWNGVSWSTLGGTSFRVSALTGFNDGTGPALYAAGGTCCTLPTYLDIFKWDGTQWVGPIGNGLGNGNWGSVGALTEFNGGGGQALYAAGWFNVASAFNSQGQYTGGIPVNNIAKWSCAQ